MITNKQTNKLRWAYMDHWRIDTPQGQLSQYTSVQRFDDFLKQVEVIYPNYLPAKNVDDLLVEQIAAQQKHAF